jgi:hypothetical protein
MEVPMILPLNLIFSIVVAVISYCYPQGAYSGYFSQYDQSPTDGTIEYHQDISGRLPQDLSAYAGVVAVKDCSLVGSDAWIWIMDSRANMAYAWLPVKVFDCSGHAETTEWMEQNNIIGELGYYLARDLGVLSRGIRGKILFKNPTAVELICIPD